MEDTLPLLHPDEHRMLERFLERHLTNDEAQIILHDATLAAAFNRWLEEKTVTGDS